MFTTRLVVQLLLLFSMMVYGTVVQANNPIHIGSATVVLNEVVTPTETGELRLKTDDALFFKQQVITKDNANLTVTFRDESTFSVAPLSSVVLDEFVFNPSENVLEKTINVLKGTFRYISGFPVKGSETKIVTPFGTAGIRGSAVQGVVSETGLTLTVARGSVVFTTRDGKTVTVNEGESLSISAKCEILSDISLSSIASAMQYNENNFSMPAPALTASQILANARLNQLSVVEQKQAYATMPVFKTLDVNAKKSVMTVQKHGDEQTLIETFIKKLQDKNQQQTSRAVQDVIGATVVMQLNAEQVLRISLNALAGTKSTQQLEIASVILNTLQPLNSDLASELAGNIQAVLPKEQQDYLPESVPNVVFPPSSNHSNFFKY